MDSNPNLKSLEQYGEFVQRKVFAEARQRLAAQRRGPQRLEHAGGCLCPRCERDLEYGRAVLGWRLSGRTSKRPKKIPLTKAEWALVRQFEVTARLARRQEKRDARRAASAARRAARNVPADQRTRAAYLARQNAQT